MLRTRDLTLCLMVMSLAVYLGCGDSAPSQSDPNSLGRVISRIAAGSRDEERFKELFASTAVVPEDDRERYGNYLYNVKSVSGGANRTEAQVDIETNDNQEKLMGTFTWVCAQENGEWKMVEAPLPPAE